MRTRNGTGFIHLYANGQRVASVSTDGSGNIQYYHVNHIGSSTVITDQNSIPQQNIDYYPYGSYRPGTPTTPPSGFPGVHYTFTGQESDDETGLYNYGARLYDPLLGRFISPDSITSKPRNLQAFNRYSYVLNNPLKYTDPSGHDDNDNDNDDNDNDDNSNDSIIYNYDFNNNGLIYGTNIPELSPNTWSNTYSQVYYISSAGETGLAPPDPVQVTRLLEPQETVDTLEIRSLVPNNFQSDLNDQTYGEISSSPSFLKSVLDQFCTDYYNFVNPSLLNDRLDVAFKYGSYALTYFVSTQLVAAETTEALGFFPSKVGGGGQLQPYSELTGQWVSQAETFAVKASDAVYSQTVSFGAGLSQGFMSGYSGSPLPPSLGVQAWGQVVGDLIGTAASIWGKGGF